jgi:hypothetical protein
MATVRLHFGPDPAAGVEPREIKTALAEPRE